MAKWFWLTFAAVLLATNGCTESVTQVVVVVDAADEVAQRLTQVVVSTYDPEKQLEDGSFELVDSAPFAINDSNARGTASFPFSIGVRKHHAGRFLLVVSGYEPGKGGAAVAVIEQKAFISFVPGETSGVGIYLATPCLEQLCEERGPGDELLACYARDGEGVCDQVQAYTAAPVVRGAEFDAGLVKPEAMGAKPDADGGPDRNMDGGDGGDGDVPNVDSGYALGAAGRACPSDQSQRFACEEHASRKPVKCNGSIWEALSACPDNARCDSRIGTDQGTCLSIPGPCSGKSVGDVDVCDGTVRRHCGPDLVTITDKPCPINQHCESSGEVHCACNPGFDGDGHGGCIDHPDCPAGACTGGSCIDGTGDWSCDCPDGFAGTGTKACTPVKYCPKDACTPGGTCVDEANWSCQCASGFTGSGTKACQNIIDCPLDRCKPPNGTCRDGINAYTCECQPGYSGTDCQTDVCTPNPCQHGGSCSRASQGALCDCGASGYTGARCETDANECATTNACTSADYPCAQTSAPGYLCVGQYAEWPMPDASPGAKVAPSYDTGTAGVVVDRVTGLNWQRTLPAIYAGCTGRSTAAAVQGDACLWAEAKTYCENLELAGASDWRLPSKVELESIVDETRNPAFDSATFPSSVGYFWSISTVPTRTSVWTTDLTDGHSTTHEKSSAHFVRCVRGYPTRSSTPATRFTTDTAADTVTDTRTGLIWQRAVSNVMSWQSAQAQCASPWRLPVMKELLTLVDPVRVNVSTDPAFPGAPSERFWSSTPYLTGGPGEPAWYVHVAGGYSGLDSTTQLYRTRCVR